MEMEKLSQKYFSFINQLLNGHILCDKYRVSIRHTLGPQELKIYLGNKMHK